MLTRIYIYSLLVATSLAPLGVNAQEQTEGYLEEVIVTAEYRPVSVLELPTSITVFDQQTIERRGAVHLDQFVEPINPSVGLIIDGMDFTGIGGAASTLDIQQVEILRGPQGTLFGANALAGLINMVSNGPEDELNGRVNLTVGNYDRLTATAAMGGPLSQNTGFRLAVQSNKNDGYINNIFLDRPDRTRQTQLGGE